jgi:hypothetical protein
MTGDYEVCSPQVRAPSVIGSPPMYKRRLSLRLGGSGSQFTRVVGYAAPRLSSRVTSVAIIDDDDGIRAARGALVRYDVLTCVSVELFLSSRSTARLSVITTDVGMSGVKGWDPIDILTREDASVPVIVITDNPNCVPGAKKLRARRMLSTAWPYGDVARNIRYDLGRAGRRS